MDVREERTDQAVLPNISDPTSSGATAVFGTLLLVLAVFGPVLANSTSPTLPDSASREVRRPPPEVNRSGEPALPLGLTPPVARNLPNSSPPRIEKVALPEGPLTASRDVQLTIHASDPDGNFVRLRTWWNINGHEIETALPVLPRAYLRRGDTIVARVVASDGDRQSAPFRTQVRVVENAPPLITTFPTGFDAAGAFVYPIAAIDHDGDQKLEYRLVEGPAGMQIEAHEGRLTWLPGSEQKGRHRVRVEVRDGWGGVQHQIFDVSVRQRRPVPSEFADRTAEP